MRAIDVRAAPLARCRQAVRGWEVGSKKPRLLPWREPQQGLGWVRNADYSGNRTNMICKIQQKVVLAAGTDGNRLAWRRRCRQLGGGSTSVFATARTCLSDLSGPGLTRETR